MEIKQKAITGYFLFVLGLCLMATAYSAIPDVVKDPATREAMEYVDAKVEKIMAPYQSATSTATFSGWIDIAATITTDGSGTTTDTATCVSGSRVMGGGCYATSGSLMHSYPSASNVWTCKMGSAVSVDAYAICARVQ